MMKFQLIKIILFYNAIIKDVDDLIKNNNSNKDSTCNEETNCNSSSKKESI